MFRIGISVGRNDLNLEGHFQLGYHGKTIKNYTPIENHSQTNENKVEGTRSEYRRIKGFVVQQSVIWCVTMDDYLTSVYYDSKRSGGLGGVDRLYDDVKKERKFNVTRNQIKEWLMKQDTYTLHKPIRRRFKRNRVMVGGIDQQWQMGFGRHAIHAKI